MFFDKWKFIDRNLCVLLVRQQSIDMKKRLEEEQADLMKLKHQLDLLAPRIAQETQSSDRNNNKKQTIEQR